MEYLTTIIFDIWKDLSPTVSEVGGSASFSSKVRIIIGNEGGMNLFNKEIEIL